MEYLSLPHSRSASYKLVPEVNDGLLTNLRNPIMTFVEDTSPGAHDTLTAACDANLYSALGVDKPEEHGSCAENLVLALKELNENAGLKGARAVGADITVNIAPTPLHLFMNAPLEVNNKSSDEGAGAKGTIVKVEEPKGKKRSFVRFRMDVGQQNGGRCMAANFMVEDVQEGEDLASSVSSIKNKKPAPRKLNGDKKAETKKEEDKTEAKKDEPKDEDTKDGAKEAEEPKQDTEEKKPAKPAPKKLERKQEEPKKDESAPAPEEPKSDASQPKKKPKKLQVRAAPTKSS
jgi:hypothetical protein